MLPDVQRLAADIEFSDPADSAQLEALLERIVQMRSEFDRAHAEDLAAYLDSAADVVKALLKLGSLGPDQVLVVAAGMVRKVESAFGKTGPEHGAQPVPPPAALPDPVIKLDISLADERMLGEVMLQLGFVTQTQLEQALVDQRATDQRIGEALVARGAATWSQVNEAIAVQRRLRSTVPTNPGSPGTR